MHIRRLLYFAFPSRLANLVAGWLLRTEKPSPDSGDDDDRCHICGRELRA